MASIAGSVESFVRAQRTEAVLATLAYTLTALLIGAFLFTGLYQPTFRFHPAFQMSLIIIVIGLRVKGLTVFARTPLDLFFFGWLILAAVSQLWATTFLGRQIYSLELLEYFYIILQSWAVYRAALTVTLISPEAASRGIIYGLLGGCVLAAIIAYGQSTGLQGRIDQVVGLIGFRRDLELLALQTAATPRPSAFFSSPTMLGSFNLYGTLILVAIAVAVGQRGQLRFFPIFALLNVLLIGCSVISQTRLALLLQLGVLAAMVLFTVFRAQRSLAVLVLLLLTGAGYVIYNNILTRSDDRFAYLSQTLQRDPAADESFQVRMDAINAIKDIAPQLAPLGSGYTINVVNPYARRGDIYSRANGPDNGFLEAYLIHGIPGVLLLGYLLWVCIYSFRGLRRSPRFSHRMVGVSVFMMATVMLLASAGAVVTHSKFERGGVIYLAMGAAAGLLYVDAARRNRERLNPPPAHEA